MAADTPMLKDASQRQVQGRLLQYYVAPPEARRLAQVELRHWIPHQLDSIFRKIPGLTPNLRHFGKPCKSATLGYDHRRHWSNRRPAKNSRSALTPAVDGACALKTLWQSPMCGKRVFRPMMIIVVCPSLS